MAERRSLSTGLGFGGLSFGVSVILAVGTSVVTARLYGVNIIGEFALVTAPATVIWILSNAGEQVSAVRLLVELPQRDPRVSGIFFAVLAFSMVLTTVVGLLVLLGVYFLLRGPIGQPQLVAPAAVNTLACIFISNPAWNLETPFSAFLAGRELFWIRLVQTSTFLVLATALSFGADNVWALVAATIASWSVSLIHRIVVVRGFVDLRPRANQIRRGLEHLPEILSYGIRMVPGNLASGIAYEVGVWVLGIRSSVSEVGAYSRAWSIIRRFTEVNWRISEMLFPALVSRRKQGDDAGFARAALDTMRYVVIVALLPAAVGGGGSKAVMAIFGPGFTSANTTLAILLLVPVLSLLQSTQSTVLLATERPTAVSVASVVQMLLTVPATVGFTVWLGIAGPAIALLIGFGGALAIQSSLLRGVFDGRLRELFPVTHATGALLAYAAGFLVAHLSEGLVPGLIGSLLGVGVLGTLAYSVVLLLLVRPLPRDRERLRRLMARLRPPQVPGAIT